MQGGAVGEGSASEFVADEAQCPWRRNVESKIANAAWLVVCLGVPFRKHQARVSTNRYDLI